MLFEHEMVHLEEMNDQLNLHLENYIFFERNYEKLTPQEIEVLSTFVKYCIDENNKAIDEPRKNMRTYRQAAKYP